MSVEIYIKYEEGYVLGRVTDRRIAYINHIYVHPQYRNKGFGTKLIHEFLENLIKLGVVHVLLDDFSDNYRKPNNIYYKIGFKYISKNGAEMYANVRNSLKLLSK